tara:strand:- start:286 stop:519 length:234 start_codon:yes stop_codon:yes gene_type:complete
MIIMPKIEKYEVCTYDQKSLSWTSTQKGAINKALEDRKFTVIKTFDDIYEARKFIEGNEDYVLRYVFKEIEPDESVH